MVNEAFIPNNDRAGALLRLWNTTALPMNRRAIPHSHLQFEVVLFRSGRGIYTTTSGTHTIQSGDVFVFSSNEQHCITEVETGEPFQFMNLHFEPRYVWGSKYNGFSSEGMNICFSHNEDFCNRLPRNNADTERVRSLMQEIERELERMEPEYELMVHNRVYELLVVLARRLNYGFGRSVTAEEYSRIRSVRTAIDYINHHLTENITLKDIADRVDLSPNYFSYIFKKSVGITLWDYITSKRIESAMALLSGDGNRKMIDIAADCGFNNTANFNKMFRRMTGLTPTEFRRHGEHIG